MLTLIAHRSGPTVFPEQTIPSALFALENGADMIEMDLRLTSDGVPVISHDPNAQRVFGIDRQIADMTKTEFLSLRHADASAYPSHLLKDALASGAVPMLLHCKVSGEALLPAIRLIKQMGLEKKVTLGIQQVGDAEIVKRESRDIRLLAFMPEAADLPAFCASGVDYIRLWESWVTAERIDAIHASGKECWIMACGKPENADPALAVRQTDTGYTSPQALRRWREMGVDGVLVNDVPWARGVLAN